MIDLWVEKYRPRELDDYVWRDAGQREKAEEWLRDKALPHLLFSGSPGTGKTSLAELLLKQLGIPKADILKINASRERRPDEIQERIMGFVQSWPQWDNETGIKYVILDEADAITPLAQKTLRTDMEGYADHCRVIFTANEPRKILEPILSRVQHFHFATLDQEQFLGRLMAVLDAEGVTYDDNTLLKVMGVTYPDLRKCLNVAQQNVRDRVLHAPPSEDVEAIGDNIIEVVALFQSGGYGPARKLLVESTSIDDYVSVFKYFYRNLELWGSTDEQQEDALLAIRRAIVNHSIVADAEINMAALIVELSQIARRNTDAP
jgi:replication factor C small subunit